MLIILEGCDGSGKSTLAAQLSKILDAEVIHCSQHTPNDYVFFHQIIEASKGRNIIADRFCYGQFIYQEEADRPLAEKELRTPLGLGDHEGVPALEVLHHLECEMLSAGVKAIHVTAPVEVIRERLAERNENLINGLTIEDVLVKYGAIKNLSILPWIEWNTGGVE